MTGKEISSPFLPLQKWQKMHNKKSTCAIIANFAYVDVQKTIVLNNGLSLSHFFVMNGQKEVEKMNILEFQHDFYRQGSCHFGDWNLWWKPLQVWNHRTGEKVKFKNLEEMYQYKIDGKTIKQIIEESGDEIFMYILDDSMLYPES